MHDHIIKHATLIAQAAERLPGASEEDTHQLLAVIRMCSAEIEAQLPRPELLWDQPTSSRTVNALSK